jgi:hypothetical protein
LAKGLPHIIRGSWGSLVAHSRHYSSYHGRGSSQFTSECADPCYVIGTYNPGGSTCCWRSTDSQRGESLIASLGRLYIRHSEAYIAWCPLPPMWSRRCSPAMRTCRRQGNQKSRVAFSCMSDPEESPACSHVHVGSGLERRPVVGNGEIQHCFEI